MITSRANWSKEMTDKIKCYPYGCDDLVLIDDVWQTKQQSTINDYFEFVNFTKEKLFEMLGINI